MREASPRVLRHQRARRPCPSAADFVVGGRLQRELLRGPGRPHLCLLRWALGEEWLGAVDDEHLVAPLIAKLLELREVVDEQRARPWRLFPPTPPAADQGRQQQRRERQHRDGRRHGRLRGQAQGAEGHAACLVHDLVADSAGGRGWRRRQLQPLLLGQVDQKLEGYPGGAAGVGGLALVLASMGESDVREEEHAAARVGDSMPTRAWCPAFWLGLARRLPLAGLGHLSPSHQGLWIPGSLAGNPQVLTQMLSLGNDPHTPLPTLSWSQLSILLRDFYLFCVP
ncbi:hypothetical protein MC885_013697 [Smutsia gigantea]|nr:hypothetical protein MC885_013697 [Smutsia gigantea]